MYDKKKASLFILLAFVFIMGFSNDAFAYIEKGKNYDLEMLSQKFDGSRTWQWTSVPERILHNGIWQDYVLSETATEVTLETGNAGSLVFHKNTCTYDFYNAGHIGVSSPTVENIGWLVKGKLSSSSNWSNVNSVNNAACNVTVQSWPDKVKITGEKADTVGTFQIVLDYVPGEGIKETMRAYNNNPAWNNHHIGFVESFDVPQYITFGGQQFNLANYNGTVLGRNWIDNNQSKLLKFTDSLFYDFGIGYDNLENVKIVWNGSKATIQLNYLFTNTIVPYQQLFEVDPTFGYTTGTHKSPFSVVGNCNTNGGGNTAGVVGTDGAANFCYYDSLEWNTAAIPDGSIITNTRIRYDSTVLGGTPACNVVKLNNQPSTRTNAQLQGDIIAGAVYTAITCNPAQTNTVLDLGNTADADVQSRLSANWFAIGIIRNPNALAAIQLADFDDVELEVTFTTKGPYAVTDLTATGASSTSVDLDWTTPNTGNGTLQGYQINYTTPFGLPQTVLVNNSGTATDYTVTGLTTGSNYSFRVAIQTTSGYNASGNIANVTVNFIAANFTIGSLNFNAENPNIFPIRFERTDSNATYTTLKVIYDTDYLLSCTFDYQLAQTQRTYSNISETTYSSTQVYHDFNFHNPGNEIIRADCVDFFTNDTGTYTMTQSTFPLLEQIANFRNGTYGTMGMIGAIDFITLAIILFSTVGFSRVNETMAAIINIALLGALWYFDIVVLPTLFLGVIAVIIVVIIGSTRRD